MPISDIIVLELGTSIAKAILKFWLQDKSIISDMTSDIVDLVKTKTSDILFQRRLSRNFEALADRVAENLEPLIKAENLQLSDDDRNLIIDSVTRTINNAKLDANIIIEKNINPHQIFQLLLKFQDSETVGYSEKQTSVFNRILEDASQYIVDITASLPAFNEHALGEILQRENQLIESTDKILETIKKIRSDEFDERYNQIISFENNYLSDVYRKLNKLELFGADVSSISKKQDLSIAYITLSVSQDLELKNKRTKAKEFTQTKKQIRLLVEKVLEKSTKLLIRGDAGSGKTTLLHWVAVKAAKKEFEGNLSLWNGKIPFFIRLRQFIESDLPTPEDFPRLVAPLIADSMPKGWSHTHLSAGNAVVMIDGADEVPINKRETVRIWIEDLVETFPQCIFLVTSRPSAVGADWLKLKNFDHAFMLPMDDLNDIHVFIDHWHNAVIEAVGDLEEKQDLENLRGNLKLVVNQNKGIRELASSPLLCALLCALHRDTKQQLPSDRVELYRACIAMLLHRRDIERKIELKGYPSLSFRQKESILQDLAYWMFKNELSLVSKEKAIEQIDRKLKKMQIAQSESLPADVLRLLIDRSGILREPAPNEIDFSHRTFQEFLVAQAIIDEGDIGYLINNSYSDQWREVIVLAAGVSPQKTRQEIIKSLLIKGDKVKHYQHQLYFLALACSQSIIDLRVAEQNLIKNRLKKIIPPKSINEAKSMALAVGELALDYLKPSPNYSPESSVLCIKAICNIESEKSLYILAEYTADTHYEVIQALLEARENFGEKQKYDDIVLSKFAHIESIECTSLSILDGIEKFTKLTRLSLVKCSRLNNIFPLAHLTNLTYLDLSECNSLIDLSPLIQLSKLNSLNLSDCENLSDISALASLRFLEWLDLSNTRVSELTALENSILLKYVDLSDCRKLESLRGLEKISALKFLNISLSDNAMISNNVMTRDKRIFNLENGRLEKDSFYFEPISMKTISMLNNLTEINLSNRVIDDPYLLANLANLETLKMQSCAVKDNSTNKLSRFIDFTFLENLLNLKTLELKGCLWNSSHSVLSKLKQLNTLSTNLLYKKQNHDNNLQTTNKLLLRDNKGEFAWWLSPYLPNSLMYLSGTFQNSLEPYSSDKHEAQQIRQDYYKWLFEAHSLDSNFENEEEETDSSNINFLQDLHELKNLALQSCQFIEDLNDIGYLKKLEKLILISCSSILNLSSFESLKSLRELTLIESKNLRHISSLQDMKSMSKLVITNCAEIEDLSALENITNIKRIAIPYQLRQKMSKKQIRHFSKVNKLSEQRSFALEIEFDNN